MAKAGLEPSDFSVLAVILASGSNKKKTINCSKSEAIDALQCYKILITHAKKKKKLEDS